MTRTECKFQKIEPKIWKCVCGQRDEYLPLKMNNSYLNTNEFKTQSKTHLINPGFLF